MKKLTKNVVIHKGYSIEISSDTLSNLRRTFDLSKYRSYSQHYLQQTSVLETASESYNTQNNYVVDL